MQQLSDKADRVRDQESQFLLRSIIDDERTSLTFLRDALKLLTN